MVERTLISFPSQLQLIERLQNLLYLSSSMVFISGEEGSGKSTLIEQLSNQLPSATQQAFISLVEPISATQIRLQIISQLFEHPLFDAEDSLSNSLQLLKSKSSDTARVVVIDHADLLPEPLLNEIAEVLQQKALISDNEINFILLGGELKTKQMLQQVKQLPGKQAIAALSFKLPALAINEAQQLLRHCLEQVSYSAKIPHQDALAKQLLSCQGIPGKILLLATEISSGNIEEEKISWIKTRFPAILLMLILVAVATGLAFFLYPQFIKSEVEVETIVETEAILLDEIQSTALTTAEQQPTEPLAGQWSNHKQLISDNQLSVGEADNEERVTISETQLFNITQSSTLATIDNSDLNSNTVVEQEALEIEPTISNESLVTVVNSSAALATSTAEILKVESAASNVETQQAESVEQSEIVVNKATIEAHSQNPLLSASDLLLAIDPEHYTLQLAGLSSEKSLIAFSENYQLPQKDVYLYQTMRNGKKWYVVIYGHFASRELAIKAAKNRPNLLSKLDIWVKKYALVHQDLQLNEQ